MSSTATPTDEVGMPGPWQRATVLAVRTETATAKTFTLKLSEPRPHLPGQHYIVRLTAPDGYRAQRSYSVASPPGGDTIDLTVEHLPDGEVSSFLHEAVMPGDNLEVRGPIGYFAWDSTTPVLGVAGGSGVVPLMAMLRAARRDGHLGLIQLVVSVRTPADLYYHRELPGPDAAVIYTRQVPAGFSRPAGRLTVADLAPAIRDNREVAYLCGSSAFCDSAASLLRDLEVPAARIRVERFGPSG